MKSLAAFFLSRPFRIRGDSRRLGLTLAIGSLLFGGTYGALAKGLTGYLSPISLLLASEGLMGIFILFTVGTFPLLKIVSAMRRREVAVAALVGMLNSGLAPYLWFTGLRHTTAVNASILTGADVIFTLILGWLILSERINRWQGMGMIIALAGIVAINLDGGDLPLTVHLGDLLVLAGVAVFSLGAVVYKKYLAHVSVEAALFIRNVAGIAVMLVVSAFITHPFLSEIAAFPLEKITLLLAFAFFARYLHLTFFYEALDRLPAVQIGLIDNAAPLAGVLFAVLLLGESVHLYQAFGANLILFGLVLEHTSKGVSERHVRRARFHVGH